MTDMHCRRQGSSIQLCIHVVGSGGHRCMWCILLSHGHLGHVIAAGNSLFASLRRFLYFFGAAFNLVGMVLVASIGRQPLGTMFSGLSTVTCPASLPLCLLRAPLQISDA